MSINKRKLAQTIFRGLGVTAVSLVFQACYGAPQDFGLDVCIQGSVKSKRTQQAIKGIRVSVSDACDYTGDKGNYRIYVPLQDVYDVRFEDVDGAENGAFAAQNKTVSSKRNILLDIELDDAE